MSATAVNVTVPEWDEARIEAIAEAMLQLIDDDGRINVLDHHPEAVAVAQQAGIKSDQSSRWQRQAHVGEQRKAAGGLRR